MDASTKTIIRKLSSKTISKMRLNSRQSSSRASLTAAVPITPPKRVRFSEEKPTMYHAVQYYDQDPKTEQEDRAIRWYDRDTLRSLFLKDLEEHLWDQVHSSCTADPSSTDGRGLEVHFAHNQRRKVQAQLYRQALVEKCHAVRRSIYNYTPRLARRKAYQDVWAEQLQEFSSQRTAMTRDWAAAEGARDEAAARAIYESDASRLPPDEEEDAEEEDAVGITEEELLQLRATSDALSQASSSKLSSCDSVHSQLSFQRRSQKASATQRKSFTAQSA